jgi:hypothetical protein
VACALLQVLFLRVQGQPAAHTLFVFPVLLSLPDSLWHWPGWCGTLPPLVPGPRESTSVTGDDLMQALPAMPLGLA